MIGNTSSILFMNSGVFASEFQEFLQNHRHHIAKTLGYIVTDCFWFVWLRDDK